MSSNKSGTKQLCASVDMLRDGPVQHQGFLRASEDAELRRIHGFPLDRMAVKVVKGRAYGYLVRDDRIKEVWEV